MKVIEKEILNATKTTKGKLYILGTLIGFSAFTLSISSAISCLLDDNKKVRLEIIFMNFLMAFSILFKLPYIYDKVLARIVSIIMLLGFITSSIIYLIAYFKNHKSKH